MNNSEVSYPPCIEWRPVIKALGFRCDKCHTLLWDKDDATKELIIENKPLSESPVCKCALCGTVVARITK